MRVVIWINGLHSPCLGSVKRCLQTRPFSSRILCCITERVSVVGAAHGLVCVWDPARGSLIQTFEHKYATTAIQHDDSKVISGCERLVRVRTGKRWIRYQTKDPGWFFASRLQGICVLQLRKRTQLQSMFGILERQLARTEGLAL